MCNSKPNMSKILLYKNVNFNFNINNIIHIKNWIFTKFLLHVIITAQLKGVHMDKKDKQEFLRYIEEMKQNADPLYLLMESALSNAEAGDNFSQICVDVYLNMFRLSKIYLSFYSSVAHCTAYHITYKDNIEEFQRAFWGNPIGFDKAINEFNKKYEAVYKTARGLNEEHKKIRKTSEIKVKKFTKEDFVSDDDGLLEFYKQIGISQQQVYEEGKPLTFLDLKNKVFNIFDENGLQMDKELTQVRSTMKQDFQLGELARGVIVSSKADNVIQMNRGGE